MKSKDYILNFNNFINQLVVQNQLCDSKSIIDSINNYEQLFPNKSTYIPESGFDIVLSSLLKPRIDILINELYYLTEKCESPIEVLMLFGLLIIGQEYHDTVNVRIDDKALFKIGDTPYELMIEPQKKIGKYRVDFLLSSTDYYPKFKEDGYYTKKLIVECDGKKYHSSSKQKQMDKKRDFELNILGFQVYHYTGSEIWNELMSRIEYIMKTFLDKNVA